MQIGFNLPNSGPLSKVADMTRLAVEGEAMGFDYLTVTDHVVLPDMAEPGYPYSESGAFYSTDSAYRHEMLTLAAWLASEESNHISGRLVHVDDDWKKLRKSGVNPELYTLRRIQRA